jgi:hypothetical protein
VRVCAAARACSTHSFWVRLWRWKIATVAAFVVAAAPLRTALGTKQFACIFDGRTAIEATLAVLVRTRDRSFCVHDTPLSFEN